MDVVAQGLQRRDIDHLGFIRERLRARRPHQAIEANQEGGQRLSGTGGSGNKDVASGGDFGPAEILWLGGRTETIPEPLFDNWIKSCHSYLDSIFYQNAANGSSDG